MIRFYDHDRKAYTSSIKINNETFFLAILAYFQHLLNGWCFLMVAYPALKSILSDLDQLAHTHFDKHCYNTSTRLLYWSSCASKSMESFFVTLRKLIAPSLRVWHQEGFARGEKRSTPGHVQPLQPASCCPCRGTSLALTGLGSNMFRLIPRGSFAAEQHKCVPALTYCHGEETSRCKGSWMGKWMLK